MHFLVALNRCIKGQNKRTREVLFTGPAADAWLTALNKRIIYYPALQDQRSHCWTPPPPSTSTRLGASMLCKHCSSALQQTQLSLAKTCKQWSTMDCSYNATMLQVPKLWVTTLNSEVTIVTLCWTVWTGFSMELKIYLETVSEAKIYTSYSKYICQKKEEQQ